MDDDDDAAFAEVLSALDAASQSKPPTVTVPTAGTSSNIQPAPLKRALKQNCILVNGKQRGNPILNSIVNVPYEWETIVPDYIVGQTTCIIYLSLKYHNLNPDYITQRLKELGKMFELRILLVQVDIKDPHNALKTLTRVALLANMTLVLAWTPEEAGKIIETYKLFENKAPDLIMERAEEDPHSRVS